MKEPCNLISLHRTNTSSVFTYVAFMNPKWFATSQISFNFRDLMTSLHFMNIWTPKFGKFPSENLISSFVPLGIFSKNCLYAASRNKTVCSGNFSIKKLGFWVTGFLVILNSGGGTMNTGETHWKHFVLSWKIQFIFSYAGFQSDTRVKKNLH